MVCNNCGAEVSGKRGAICPKCESMKRTWAWRYVQPSSAQKRKERYEALVKYASRPDVRDAIVKSWLNGRKKDGKTSGCN